MRLQKNIAYYSLIILSVALSPSLGGCEDRKAVGNVDLHYKVTIEVQTPEGVKSGSAVRAYHAGTGYDFLNKRYNVTERTAGEAVVVDLGERGKLFGVVYAGRKDSHHFVEAFTKKNRLLDPMWINDLRELKIGQNASTKPDLQLMAGFYDIQDPTTIHFMNETEECPRINFQEQCWKTVDYTEKLFGNDIFVKSVTYEVTNEPITDGEIYKLLPWLEEYKKNKWRFDGIKYDDFPVKNKRLHNIATGSFKINTINNGEKK